MLIATYLQMPVLADDGDGLPALGKSALEWSGAFQSPELDRLILDRLGRELVATITPDGNTFVMAGREEARPQQLVMTRLALGGSSVRRESWRIDVGYGILQLAAGPGAVYAVATTNWYGKPGQKSDYRLARINLDV